MLVTVRTHESKPFFPLLVSLPRNKIPGSLSTVLGPSRDCLIEPASRWTAWALLCDYSKPGAISQLIPMGQNWGRSQKCTSGGSSELRDNANLLKVSSKSPTQLLLLNFLEDKLKGHTWTVLALSSDIQFP